MTCLNKGGIVSTISRNIVFGTHKYCALNFDNLYRESGLQKLKMLLGHIRKGNKTGSILKIALGTTQQEIGISQFFLSQPYDQYQHLLTTSWHRELWIFLNSIDGTIEYPEAWVPAPILLQDINLTTYITSLHPPPHIQYIFNICRLHKRAYYLGDLLEPNGIRLKPGALTLNTRQYYDNKFPSTQIPLRNSVFVDVWQTYIRHLLRETPLGSALGPIIGRQAHKWCLDEHRTTLIRYQRGKPRSYHLVIDDLNFDPILTQLTTSIVPHSVATVITTNALIFKHHKPIHTTTTPTLQHILTSLSFQITPQTEQRSFIAFLTSLPAALYHNIGQLENLDHLSIVASYLQQNKLIGVGDASV